MSRQIDLDRPLNEEDRAYLLNRGRRHLVIQNNRRFGADGVDTNPPVVDDEDDEWETEVMAMNMDQLKAALQKRSLPVNGKKDDLQDRLIDAGPPAEH